MSRITAALPYIDHPHWHEVYQGLLRALGANSVQVLAGPNAQPNFPHQKIDAIQSAKTLSALVAQGDHDLLLLLLEPALIRFGPRALERFQDLLHSSAAPFVYSDYWKEQAGTTTLYPLNDYQSGSVRDNFEFGPIVLIDCERARHALSKYGALAPSIGSGWYDLRLKLSLEALPFHAQEPLYTKIELPEKHNYEAQFSYVDPSNRAQQLEREQIFTDYAKKAGFYLTARSDKADLLGGIFNNEVSVIIPVKNRKKTVGEAVLSALNQKFSEKFNVIVVDNHSDDGTSAVLQAQSKKDPRVIHLKPKRTDLQIGGCWNEALYSPHCGRFAIQLDSDDLYSGRDTISSIYECFRKEHCAAVVGSYRLVDFDLNEIPPGLIDHKEWSAENGHNNALRINGLGAPRAFFTPIARSIGFLNTSYGEDYAMMLAISRRYQIGRIYESLYLCRRWGGNSDANLPIEKINRNDSFKDKVRTLEILARQRMNG